MMMVVVVCASAPRSHSGSQADRLSHPQNPTSKDTSKCQHPDSKSSVEEGGREEAFLWRVFWAQTDSTSIHTS